MDGYASEDDLLLISEVSPKQRLAGEFVLKSSIPISIFGFAEEMAGKDKLPIKLLIFEKREKLPIRTISDRVFKGKVEKFYL